MTHIILLIFVLVCGLFFNVNAQNQQPKNENSQQNVTTFTPVKPDTANPNTKALNKFSKDNMFNVSTPPKQLKPEEVLAMSLFNDGSKKGKAGDYQGAILDFTKSLDHLKKESTYVKRGYAFMMTGNYSNAIQDATEALRMQPAILQAYFVRGLSRFETGDLIGSKEDLDLYLNRDRTNSIAFNYMAALLFINQDYKGSLENYDEVVRLDPKYPDIYTNRGMMRHYVQDFKGAIQDYNEALKQNSDNPTAYNNRGAAKMMLKEMDAALADFNKALTINDKYADAYDNRGRVKHALGDLTGACADWQMAYSNGLEASRDLIMEFCK